jgi:hypothetical protein
MKKLLTLPIVIASPTAFALVVAPTPSTVPVMDMWGLIAMGSAVALAGAIAAYRIRKNK